MDVNGFESCNTIKQNNSAGSIHVVECEMFCINIFNFSILTLEKSKILSITMSNNDEAIRLLSVWGHGPRESVASWFEVFMKFYGKKC